MWVKDPFKVQNRPTDFNLTGCQTFTDMVWGFTLQLIFQKLLLFKCSCDIKEECEKSVTIILSF